MAKWAAIPVSMTAGGVLVADFTIDDKGFVIGAAAVALGYVTRIVTTKWPTKWLPDQG
jgi:hypothetical protein